MIIPDERTLPPLTSTAPSRKPIVLFSADWMQLWRYWCDLWFILDIFDEYLEVVEGEGGRDA
jgi:hypothetical protein